MKNIMFLDGNKCAETIVNFHIKHVCTLHKTQDVRQWKVNSNARCKHIRALNLPVVQYNIRGGGRKWAVGLKHGWEVGVSQNSGRWETPQTGWRIDGRLPPKTHGVRWEVALQTDGGSREFDTPNPTILITGSKQLTSAVQLTYGLR